MTATAAEARQLVQASQAAQINVGAYTAGMVAEVFELLRAGEISENEFPAAHLLVAQYGHETAAIMMAQFVEGYRAAVTPGQTHASPLLAAFDANAAYGRASAALAQVTALDSSQVGYNRQFAAIVEQFSVREARHVLNAGRDTLTFSTAANKTRWRRVTDGNPCAFCAMLATREDYLTKESALRVVGRASGYGTAQYKATGQLTWGGTISRGKNKGKDRRRGTRAPGEKYHDMCGCTVAEVIGEWESTDTERGHADLYDRATKACEKQGLPPTTENVLAKMRELGDGVVHDAHKPRETQAGSAGPASVTGLTEAQFEARLNAAMDAGNWDLAERLGELWDAKQAQPAATPQTADPGTAFNAETYDWFEGLSDDEQLDFVDTLPERYREDFWREQWAHTSGRSARRDVPTEREIRAEWDNYVDLEWLRLEDETRGNVLSREAAAKGRDPRDLWRVNSRTARSWASEETRRYWDEHGRLTYAEFRAAALGSGLSDLQAGKGGGYWA